jgi:hypothetical protein
MACVVKVSEMLHPGPGTGKHGAADEPDKPVSIARPLNRAYNLDTLFKDRAARLSVRKRI